MTSFMPQELLHKHHVCLSGMLNYLSGSGRIYMWESPGTAIISAPYSFLFVDVHLNETLDASAPHEYLISL